MTNKSYRDCLEKSILILREEDTIWQTWILGLQQRGQEFHFG